MSTTSSTRTKPTAQRGTRQPLGQKKTILPFSKPPKPGLKKSFPGPLKPRQKQPIAANKSFPKSISLTKPKTSTTPKPQPKQTTVSGHKAKPTPQPPAPEPPGNWINRTVQNHIAGVGNYAGGLVNSVGNGVNKIGEGIASAISDKTRGWGQGVADYGNGIKDKVGVGGKRAETAQNPLGLAGNGAAKSSGGGQTKGIKGPTVGSAGNPLGLTR